MLGVDVTLEVDGANEVYLGVKDESELCHHAGSHLLPAGLPVDGALVELVVPPAHRVDGVDEDHRHRLVQHLSRVSNLTPDT